MFQNQAADFLGENQSDVTKKVTASIFPIYDITKNVAGDAVTVELLLPPGATPHSYTPSPSDIQKIVDSQVVFTIGHGLDDWAATLAEDSAEKSIVVTLDDRINLLETAKHDHNHEDEAEHEDAQEDEQEDVHNAEHEGEHGDEHENEHEDEEHDEHKEVQDGADGSAEILSKDPHYWLSLPNAIEITNQVTDELSQVFPEHADEFAKNAESFKAEIETLQQEVELQLGVSEPIEIATFHNAWGYFGRDHNIEIVATFEEYAGEEPSATYLKEFSEAILENNIRLIFSEPQLSTSALVPIAQDLQAEIGVLDPIGGVEGRSSYLELMRYNFDQILSAQSGS